MGIFFSYLLYFTLSTISLGIFFLAHRHKYFTSKLPPGRKGWPIIGETLHFVLAAHGGNPEKFINDRMNKYSPEVFRTFLMEENMAVMCGASGNKFLFSNENKLVTSWWHRSLKKILYFPSLFDNPETRDQIKTPTFLPEFLRPEAQKHYVAIMDVMAGMHIDKIRTPYKEVTKVLPLAKKYTFALSCRLFMNVDDPDCVARIRHPFEIIMAGFFSVPLDIPGTAFNRAIKARDVVHKEILEVVKKRKMELAEKGINSAARDLLSLMLLEENERGEVYCEREISTHLICLLLVSTDSTSAVITFVLKYLSEFPSIYRKVLKANGVAKSKSPQEHLNWDDIQKMRYTWNVVNETMRLTPPVQGAFREVTEDFTYAGFTIPKGWKTHWNVNTTHRNPKYFQNPEKFDPSRFERRGLEPFTFVPFGGGPRMCPGREYARAQILVFMHNIVTKFEWERVDPKEKISYNPSPMPAKGLPVRLQPLEKTM